NGTDGDDMLIGTPASEALRGFGGDDTLDGRGDDDTLDGGLGSDLYIHRVGEGFDSVVQTSGDADSTDHAILTQGSGDPLVDVNWHREGDDLLIAGIVDPDDAYDFESTGFLRIVGHYSGEVDGLDYF